MTLLRLWRVITRRRTDPVVLNEEMSGHLEALAKEYRSHGLSADAAQRAARVQFGNVASVREEAREHFRFGMIEWIVQDLRYALRTLRRTPGFTFTAMATLALGIGAVTVIYSVIHNVLLEPFPYTDPRGIVNVRVGDVSSQSFRRPTPSEFLDFQQQNDIFADVAGTTNESMYYIGESRTELLSVGLGTPNMFTFLGVNPLHGRYFGPADATPQAPAVAVLNHRSWMTIFGGDPSIVGRRIVLDDQPWTVVGVMPPRFEWHVADVWIPRPWPSLVPASESPNNRAFQARLRSGVTVAEAQTQMNRIAARRATVFPEQYPQGLRTQVVTTVDWVVGQFRGVLYTLFAAVGLLLAIACCNVANMLLARGIAREREITVRAALGANRSRIVKQLLVESLLLAAGGLVGGCLLAYAGIELLASLLPRQGVAWETELKLDVPVLWFAAGTAGLATLAFGLFPSFHGARQELLPGAGHGGRGSTASRRQHRMRSALVVTEVALSVLLLIGAGLLARSFVQLATFDLGVDPAKLLVAGLAIDRQAKPAIPDRFHELVAARLRALPGVQSVGFSSALWGGTSTTLELPGSLPGQTPEARVMFSSDGFAETLGLRLRLGRSLSGADVAGARKVAIVNETLVRHQFSAANPIGRLVRLERLTGLPTPVQDPTFEIIGVVEDIPNAGPRAPVIAQLYVPHSIVGADVLPHLLVRTALEPIAMLASVREQIRQVSPHVALVSPETLARRLERTFYAQPRFSVVVLAMCAVTGLGLVALGVYGVISYVVSQRMREFAIRMALGGDKRHVLEQILRTTLKLVGVGTALGLGLGLAASRVLRSQLWETTPSDPATFVIVGALVILIGIGACLLPASRGMRVQPAAVFRQD